MALLYALIAMQIERIPTVKDLVKKLKENPVLRYNCGFDVLEIVPSESTFSRFLNKLSSSDELSILFREIVLQAKESGIIDGNNVSIDSTKISSYEASVPKSKIVHYGYPYRGSENWQKLYNTRTSIERMFSRMKDYLNLDNIRSKGILKAKAYVLLNCIALVDGTLQ